MGTNGLSLTQNDFRYYFFDDNNQVFWTPKKGYRRR